MIKTHENWATQEWKTLLELILKHPNGKTPAHSDDLCRMAVRLLVFQPPGYFGLNYPKAYRCASRAWVDSDGEPEQFEALAREYYSEVVCESIQKTLRRKAITRTYQPDTE